MGSNLACRFKAGLSDVTVIAFDNLARRGSELTVSRLKATGVQFVHGDVRYRQDVFAVGDVDLIVECAADASVLAGRDGSARDVIDANLVGACHCLDLARRCGAALVFLSTSRVYPYSPLDSLPFRESDTRFEIESTSDTPGVSPSGVTEQFPLDGPRTLYGASKLAAETIIAEYVDMFGVKAIVNRCGLLTGPWQMGKPDQGVVVLWAARHSYNRSLSYIGYGGQGKQVRDILHVDDLFDLLLLQLRDIDRYTGQVFNVGGGPDRSVSLLELTDLCRQATGRSIPITPHPEPRYGDVKWYVSDCRRVEELSDWRPRRDPPEIVDEIARWLSDHRSMLEPILT